LEPRVKLWLELNGRVAMSDYRARLLRHVRDSGSLAHAASAMGLSYRRAWGKVRELEQNLGCAVIQSDVGGVGGGKSRLTAVGEELLARYDAFESACEASVADLYAHVFADFSSTLGSTTLGSGQPGEQVQPVADDPVCARLHEA
jgi:molybdate transport system regulatory protein